MGGDHLRQREEHRQRSDTHGVFKQGGDVSGSEVISKGRVEGDAVETNSSG